jgi:uncharacterized protein (DUF58 family)
MPNPISWLTPQFIGRLEALQLSVKWVRAGHRLGGRFPINRRGSSVEFADYAAYAPGDDIRSIDWNLYARLDVSLGYIALADGHHVRLSWIRGGPLTANPSLHQRNDLFRLADLAAPAGVDGQTLLADWMERAAVALRIHGGQAILVTDGMTRPADFFRALHVLMVRNLEIKVIQVLSPQELHPSRLMRGGVVVDAETGTTHELAYSPAELERAVAEHNETLVRFCKRHGIPFARHRLDDPLETFITKTLPALGFLE